MGGHATQLAHSDMSSTVQPCGCPGSGPAEKRACQRRALSYTSTKPRPYLSYSVLALSPSSQQGGASVGGAGHHPPGYGPVLQPREQARGGAARPRRALRESRVGSSGQAGARSPRHALAAAYAAARCPPARRWLLVMQLHAVACCAQEMDEEAAIMGSVQRSKRYLEEMFESGTNILAHMGGNRERLKVRRRAGDCRGLGPLGLGVSAGQARSGLRRCAAVAVLAARRVRRSGRWTSSTPWAWATPCCASSSGGSAWTCTRPTAAW
jgi:hypothetical protein